MRANKQSTFDNSIQEIEREIATMKDDEDKMTSICMLVVISAVQVGANIGRLVECTDYPRDFIEAIDCRMRKAGIWLGEFVDAREWSDDGEGIFLHAQVAQGLLLREANENGGCRYLDAESGELALEWNPPVIPCRLGNMNSQLPGTQKKRLRKIKAEIHRLDAKLS